MTFDLLPGLELNPQCLQGTPVSPDADGCAYAVSLMAQITAEPEAPHRQSERRETRSQGERETHVQPLQAQHLGGSLKDFCLARELYLRRL